MNSFRKQIYKLNSEEPLPPPTGLIEVASTDSAIAIKWDAVTFATGYNVYVDSVFYDTTSGITMTIIGLTASTSYGVQVSSLKGIIESELSLSVGMSTTATP